MRKTAEGKKKRAALGEMPFHLGGVVRDEPGEAAPIGVLRELPQAGRVAPNKRGAGAAGGEGGGAYGFDQITGLAADALQFVRLGHEQALAGLEIQADADDHFGAGPQTGFVIWRHHVRPRAGHPRCTSSKTASPRCFSR